MYGIVEGDTGLPTVGGAPDTDGQGSDGHDRQLAALMAEVGALRHEVQRLNRENRQLSRTITELERVSERDTLTPLYNRRHFLAAMRRRQARLRRHGEDVAVIFVDVDGLKRINDRHGHAAGDAVLRSVAARLAGAIRVNDLAARIGGDEFALLLDRVSAADAATQVRRFAALLATAPVMVGDQAVPVTASFGIAMLGPDDGEEAILARADADMYATRSGR